MEISKPAQGPHIRFCAPGNDSVRLQCRAQLGLLPSPSFPRSLPSSSCLFIPRVLFFIFYFFLQGAEFSQFSHIFFIFSFCCLKHIGGNGKIKVTIGIERKWRFHWMFMSHDLPCEDTLLIITAVAVRHVHTPGPISEEAAQLLLLLLRCIPAGRRARRPV